MNDATTPDELGRIVYGCPGWCTADHDAELADEISRSEALHTRMLDPAERHDMERKFGPAKWQPGDSMPVDFMPIHTRRVGSMLLSALALDDEGELTVAIEADEEGPTVLVVAWPKVRTCEDGLTAPESRQLAALLLDGATEVERILERTA
jgi:hypothetical protein